jgi:mono/diheme cytochrome c family protein
VTRRKTIPAKAPLVALALAVVGTLILSGCGVSTEGDFDRGKQLFAAKCSQCHALKDAGSTSTLGPDLDAAFAQARASGMDPETVSGVVKNQVENPRPAEDALGQPNPSVNMPANLVTGSDLEDVAHYLGVVAGNPDIEGPQLPDDPGAQVFAQNNCAGCHTLAAADASGTVGPDLDDVVPNNLKTAAAVEEAIVDPNKDIAPGFPPNVMPQTYGQDLSPKELDDLVQFLLKYSGQKGGSSGTGGSSK